MLPTLIATGVIGPGDLFSQFKGVFPAFSDITAAQYEYWTARAARITFPLKDCLGDEAVHATWLLTAHYLVQQGIGTGTEAEMAAQGASGFKRIKSGTIDLERADNTSSASMGDYGTTSYGQQVWPMLKACVAGPRVTGTGALCGGYGYNGFAGPLPTWGR